MQPKIHIRYHLNKNVNLYFIGTNIHAALINGIEKLSEKHDPERSLALLFLTDGQANSGEWVHCSI